MIDHRAREQNRPRKITPDAGGRGPRRYRVSTRPRPRKPRSVRGGELVLRLRVEVAGVVALVQLLGRIAGGAVDHAPALHGRPRVDLVSPAVDVLVLLRAKELGAAV